MDDGERRGGLKRKEQKITMRMFTCRTKERTNIRWEGKTDEICGEGKCAVEGKGRYHADKTGG